MNLKERKNASVSVDEKKEFIEKTSETLTETLKLLSNKKSSIKNEDKKIEKHKK